MKNFLVYDTNADYLADKALWNYNLPNVCRIEDYDGNNNRKVIFNRNNGLYDILWVKISDTTQKRITHNVLNPSEGYKPIALRVIGENFLGLGEHSRWMALKYMYFDNMSNTETGTRPFVENAQNGSLTNVGMTWDETSVYTPKTSTYTQEQLNTSRYKADWTNINYSWPDLSFSDGINVEANFQNTTRVSKQYDWAYLPSDAFNNYYITAGTIGSKTPLPEGLFYVDNVRGWHSDPVSNNRFLPSLYTEDNKWVVSENTSEFTYPTHALTRIHGKDATDKIVSKYASASPIDTSSVTYVGKCDYQTRLEQLKPFYCCSQYKTLGTSAGDWYLPACGELAFIIPDLKHIRARLAEISSVYPEDCMSSLANTTYWSASEYGWYYAWYVYTNNGHVSNRFKNHLFTVLAFLQYDA